MKQFSGLSLLTLSIVLGLFVFSCATDKEEGTSNFSSQEEATAAVDDLEAQGFFNEVQSDVDGATSQATNFSPSYTPGYFKAKKERGRLSKARGVQDFSYSSASGFWIYTFSNDTSYTDFDETINSSEDVLYKIRFTEHDIVGLPTANTNLMEWVVDVGINEDISGSGTTSSFSFSFDSDMDVNGISGFKAGTGNLTIDGSGHQDFVISATSGPSSINFSYHTSHNVNSLVLSPDGNYPESGSVSFTARRSVSPAILEQSIPNFNVAGTITYNNTNIAVLEIGGYTFHINLDTGSITPV